VFGVKTRQSSTPNLENYQQTNTAAAHLFPTAPCHKTPPSIILIQVQSSTKIEQFLWERTRRKHLASPRSLGSSNLTSGAVNYAIAVILKKIQTLGKIKKRRMAINQLSEIKAYMRGVYQRADIRAANLAAATINREVNNPSLRSAGELCMRLSLCFVHARPFAWRRSWK
jgi:hypothetical protein